jgi:outer membrane protein assembly factor BamA
MKSCALCWLLLLSSAALAQPCKDGRAPVELANVEFRDTPGLTPELEAAIVETIRAHDADGCETLNEMAERARDLAQQRGYFKALVEDPKSRLALSNESKRQNVFFVIKLGQVYRLAAVNFSDTSAFGTDELRAAVPMADGDIFNVQLVRKGLKNLRELYRAHGYTDFVPVPNTQIDDQHRLITLTLDMVRGTNQDSNRN